ncbi:MAG: alpha-amylase family glycosyl hydrolase, partial [Ignavibacteriaceae bacterium]
SISSALFHVKNGASNFDTTVTVTNGIFNALLHLANGDNVISASVTKNLQNSISKGVIFNYHTDFSTNIVIKYNISGKNVTLDAGQSKNNNNLPVSFSWQADPNNPAAVTLSNSNSALTSYTSPATDGEYYFTLKVMNSKDTSWAKALVVVNSGSPDTVNLKTWHSSWIDKSVVYEIYTKSFSFAGNLAGIIPQLQRLKNLGINCIWLMPIMPAASPHGYNITDYYDINPELGTKQDFKDLIDAAHQLGIKIMMDLVINHTSAVHPFMEDAYKYKQYSPYYNFYEWDSQGDYKYLFNWWDLPNINYEQKWVRDYLIRMVKYWVEGFDIDGYRCDVAWGVNDNRISGPAFWQRFRNTLKEIKPDIFLLAEAQADQLRYFDDKFDSGYDWPFFNKLKDVLNHNSSISSLDSLIQWYQGSNYLSYIRPFRFLENHDEDRFISKFSPEQTKLAASILLTLPGVPMIYAGQETGEVTQRNMISWDDKFNLQVYYQKLILARDKYPALQQGKFIKFPNSSPDSAYSYLRMSGD